VVDFLLGGFLGHVDNHGLVLLVSPFLWFAAKTKAAISGSRLAVEACLVSVASRGSSSLQAAPQPLLPETRSKR